VKAVVAFWPPLQVTLVADWRLPNLSSPSPSPSSGTSCPTTDQPLAALTFATHLLHLEQYSFHRPVDTSPPTMASRTPTPDSMGPRDRLPNLFEVLSRRTTAPVDLFSFYIYMRDVQRSVDYLDFW
jgi:hypothetical protein